MLLQNQLQSILYQLEGVQIVIDDAVIHVNPFLSCRAAIHVIYQVHMRAVGRSVNLEGVVVVVAGVGGLVFQCLSKEMVLHLFLKMRKVEVCTSCPPLRSVGPAYQTGSSLQLQYNWIC